MAYLPTSLSPFDRLFNSVNKTNWTYSSNADTLATILTSGYFDPTFTTDADKQNLAILMKVNDLIYVEGTNGTDYAKVSSLDPIVLATNIEDISLADGDIFVGNASNVATARTMSGDATISNTGAVTIANDAITTVKILNAAVTTVKILDGNITLAKLALGILPSDVIKFNAPVTTVGGSATEAFTVTGALVADKVSSTQMKVVGGAPVTILTAIISAPDTLTVVFSADPSNDHQFVYEITRTAV